MIYLRNCKSLLLSLGDDITESPRKFYIAYRIIRNFACVEIHKKHLLIDPERLNLKDNRLRDVSDIGHYGTGDLEIRIEGIKDIELAKELIEKAYKQNV